MTSATPLSVVLVENNRLYRDALAEQLRSCSWISSTRVIDASPQAVRAICSRPADLVIVNMNAECSRATLSALRETLPECKVVAVGVGDSDDDVVFCAELGVAGLLEHGGDLADLSDLAISISRGESTCSPKIAAALLRRVATAAQQRTERPVGAIDRLSPREREVLRLIELGCTNKEISRSLCIEVRTVKNHVHSLLQKLQLNRRGEAAAWLRDLMGTPMPMAHSGTSGGLDPISAGSSTYRQR